MLAWRRWTIAVWSNRAVGHESHWAALVVLLYEINSHLRVLPAGRPATGRRARGKRLVFRVLCVQQQRINTLIYKDTGCFCCKSNRAAEVESGVK